MSSEHITLLGLAVTLLGVLIMSTWRFSALSTKLISAQERAGEKEHQQDERLKLLDAIPTMQNELAYLKANYQQLPDLQRRLIIAEEQIKTSREMRRVRMGSRPDVEEE